MAKPLSILAKIRSKIEGTKIRPCHSVMLHFGRIDIEDEDGNSSETSTSPNYTA
jgi:hypothetical protein